MLGAKYPEVTHMSRYLNNFSEHKGPLAYSIGQDSRFKLSKSASCPGPGHYRVDREHPENEFDDVGSFSRTGCRTSPKYSMPAEARLSPEGIVKSLQLRTTSLGPGQYPAYRLNTRSSEKSFPAYSFPSAKETAEAVRSRKRASDVPGPGVYNVLRYGDELGKEKQKAMERAVKRGTDCWAAAQYSHLFTAMKPRGGASAPAPSPLEAASSASRRPAQEPQESTPAS
mmetsp:Transcript_91810/g.286192  ORF Transcript_91810/g.286192 Transcript_91810/m.286192 type:complete len:227 (-) Transcript_91810:81-761(-)